MLCGCSRVDYVTTVTTAAQHVKQQQSSGRKQPKTGVCFESGTEPMHAQNLCSCAVLTCQLVYDCKLQTATAQHAERISVVEQASKDWWCGLAFLTLVLYAKQHQHIGSKQPRPSIYIVLAQNLNALHDACTQIVCAHVRFPVTEQKYTRVYFRCTLTSAQHAKQHQHSGSKQPRTCPLG